MTLKACVPDFYRFIFIMKKGSVGIRRRAEGRMLGGWSARWMANDS